MRVCAGVVRHEVSLSGFLPNDAAVRIEVVGIVNTADDHIRWPVAEGVLTGPLYGSDCNQR